MIKEWKGGIGWGGMWAGGLVLASEVWQDFLSHATPDPHMAPPPANALSAVEKSAHSSRSWSRRPDWPFPATSCSPLPWHGTSPPCSPLSTSFLLPLICGEGNQPIKFMKIICVNKLAIFSFLKFRSEWDWQVRVSTKFALFFMMAPQKPPDWTVDFDSTW